MVTAMDTRHTTLPMWAATANMPNHYVAAAAHHSHMVHLQVLVSVLASPSACSDTLQQ